MSGGADKLLVVMLLIVAFTLAALWLTLGADFRAARGNLDQLVALLEELARPGGMPTGAQEAGCIRDALLAHSDQLTSKLPAVHVLMETNVGSASFDVVLQEALDEARSARRSLHLWPR